MRIRDYSIRRFTEDLQRQGQPAKVDDSNVVKLLAAVGDSWRDWSGSGAAAKLAQPGITRQQQLEIASSGMSATEKADLMTMLDSGMEISPGAKNFLEALVGRAPLQETFGPLTIKGDQRAGIAGIAKAGETIEAINLSTASAGRLHLTDTMVIGTADQFGKFQGTMPDMKEGDIIRLRTRAADGSTSDWLTIQARGIEGSDTRNAHVNLERMDLTPNADGTVSVTHNTPRPLSEPGATLRFTNARTGEFTDVKVTDEGSIPKDLKLPNSKAGDTINIAGSDGRNNTDFRTVAGSLQVPGGDTGPVGVQLPDPTPLKSDTSTDGTARHKLVRFTGPLFVDGARIQDVRQGAIGNCYFPAALAAVAAMNPEAIENMVRKNADGTFTVTFHESNYYGSPTEKHEITVDGDLFARSFGGPVYGSSLGTPSQPDQMEMWFPIVEKAYAQWKGGSYESIGNGGVSGKVMSEVLGRSYDYSSVSESNKDRIWQMIQQGERDKSPMTAGTHGKDEAARYANTGVYANHAYSVLGVEEENGVKYVKLRNPWGQSEPRSDGKDDGFFRLELDKFAHLYSSFAIVE